MRDAAQVKTHPLVLTGTKSCGATVPPLASTLVTSSIMIFGLVISEQVSRYIIFNMKHMNQVFEDETNRHILARHLGVDTFSCFICAYLGWSNRSFLMGVIKAAMGDKKAMDPSGAESRGFSYNPAAFFLSTFFLSYQLKNLADTILWNDGPEYIFHHVLSLAVCWSALYPGFAIVYATFFFGISEISTGVLCILANFDPDHGVIGLGEAFPITKVVIGVVFVILFIICRAVLWPILSYYYTLDALAVLKGKNPLLEGRRGVIKMHMACLVGLSVLQASWLVLIYFMAIKEFKAIGLL